MRDWHMFMEPFLKAHFQCEIYRCKRCYKKGTQISKIKAHAVKKHIMELGIQEYP